MNSSVLKQVVIAVLLVGVGGVAGFRLGQGKNVPVLSQVFSQRLVNVQQPADFSQVDFNQFWEVWRILQKSYVDPSKLNNQKQVDGAIRGMASSLEDPYTFYLPPTDQKRSSEDLAGKFYGVGIELGYKDGILSVTAPLKDSPAEKAGILAGDFILKIKDEGKKIDKDTTGMSLDEAVNIIRGEKGTKVVLSIGRKDASEPLEIAIERQEITVPTVELAFVEKDGKKAAHVSLSRFGGQTDQEWSSIVDKINSEPNVKGVLLDVRNNPGGFLESAVDIASEFIKDGVIVTQQGRVETQKYTVTRKGRLTEVPVEVLMNKGSASASEIVAGALRDRRDAKLYGENSFGKGTVQDAMELDGGAGLHVTVAKWLLPKGDWIHEKGIPATVEVKDNPDTEEDEVIMRALQDL